MYIASAVLMLDAERKYCSAPANFMRFYAQNCIVKSKVNVKWASTLFVILLLQWNRNNFRVIWWVEHLVYACYEFYVFIVVAIVHEEPV